MKKLILLMLSIILFVTAQAVPSIYPSTLEMKLDSGHGHGTFTIYNTSDKEMKYKIEVKSMDNLGNKSELSKYLKVFPRYMVIPSGEKQIVRVMVKKIPLDKFKNSEYRSAISIEELESSIQKKYKERNVENGVKTTVNFKYIINMAIYGYVGEMTPKIKVDSVYKDKKVIKGEIINIGNYSYPISYQILDKNNQILEDNILFKVLYGEKKSFSIKKIKNGEKIKLLETNKKILLYEKELK